MESILYPIYGDSMSVKPAEILLNLVRNRDVDPWNMDIVNITNQYLQEIERMKDLDIRVSGRAILASSILLRMKSDVLLKEDEDEDEKDANVEDEIEEDELNIDTEISELDPVAPPARRVKRYYSIDELVEALNDVLEEEDHKFDENGLEDDADDISKEEKFKEEIKIEDNRANIKKNVDKLYKQIEDIKGDQDSVKFRDVVLESSLRGVSRTFLYILYLINEEKIEIEQDSEYGELHIIPR